MCVCVCVCVCVIQCVCACVCVCERERKGPDILTALCIWILPRWKQIIVLIILILFIHKSNNIRIVLSWGDYVRDLDSHLQTGIITPFSTCLPIHHTCSFIDWSESQICYYQSLLSLLFIFSRSHYLV